jgi:Ca2+-binding RTX toxin-like protein
VQGDVLSKRKPFNTALQLGDDEMVVNRRVSFETLVQENKAFAIKTSDPDEKLSAVSALGDFNGDGFQDVVVGSSKNKAYVVYGSLDPKPTVDVAELDGTNGLTITGIEGTDGDIAVHSLGALGGVNDDLLWDIGIGSPSANNDAGAAYIIFGTDDGRATIDVSELNGRNGFVIPGQEEGGRLGFDMAGIAFFSSDENGAADLAFDIAIPAPLEDDGTGAVYVIFGNKAGETLISDDGVFDLADLNGENGFRITGINPGDQAGFSVSGAGDINDDNVDDFAITAPFADPNGINNAGQSYIVFGGNDFPSTVELASFDGTNGLILNGREVEGNFGFDVSGLFFFNDSFSPERFGDPENDFDFSVTELKTGNTYVFYGFDVTNNFDVSTLDGNNGLVIQGEGSGLTISGTFDLNGDEIGDLIVGGIGGDDAPAAAVIYGDEAFRDTLDLANLDESDGFLLDDANAVTSVGEAGFVTGFETLPALIAAVPDSQAVYVVYGSVASPTIGETLIGTQGDDVLEGGNLEDTIAGGWGDDEILGGDGNDILRGDSISRKPGGKRGGDDIIRGGGGRDRIGGKGGDDQLFGDDGDDRLWGDDGDDILRGGLGDDTLTGDDFSGGQGRDIFVLAADEGTDTILDFEVGLDSIGLADGLSFEQLMFCGNRIQLFDTTLAVLKGVNTTTLTADHFITV